MHDLNQYLVRWFWLMPPTWSEDPLWFLFRYCSYQSVSGEMWFHRDKVIVWMPNLWGSHIQLNLTVADSSSCCKVEERYQCFGGWGIASQSLCTLVSVSLEHCQSQLLTFLKLNCKSMYVVPFLVLIISASCVCNGEVAYPSMNYCGGYNRETEHCFWIA